MRRRLAACLGVAFVAVSGVGLGGCATQQSVDQLKDANRSLEERNRDLERQLGEMRLENDALGRQRGGGDAAVSELQRTNSELRAQLDDAQRALRDLESRMSGLSLGQLDPTTDRELAELAAQFPDLIQYDAQKGMLRFASDLTFDSGSDVVKPEAKRALDALANILKSSAASGYEVFIVGHTDSQRISAATAKRHPTNMHLSCHRAISVRQSLLDMAVPANRMFAAGWGEQRPAVPNTSSGNTPQNRRVEIFLVRGTQSGMTAASVEPTGAAPDRQSPPPRQPEISK